MTPLFARFLSALSGSLLSNAGKMMRLVISGLVVAAYTPSWAMEPICKAMMSKRSYDEAVSLIAQESDINIACNPDSKITVAVPLDMAIESAAVNPKAPELAALLLAKGAMVGGYRKDVFFFRDPKRQQEFESKPIGALFAITPEETRYTMYMWKTYVEEKAEAHRQEFLERARRQDAATFATFGNVLLGMASVAVTYQVLKNGDAKAIAQASDNIPRKTEPYAAPQPASTVASGAASRHDEQRNTAASKTPAPSERKAANNVLVAKAAEQQQQSQQQQQQQQQQQRQRQQQQQEDNARKAREQADAAAAKQDLMALKQSIQLRATTCPDGEGRYYVTGAMPKQKHDPGCIDVSYEASCPGNSSTSRGVAKNFIGMSGCYGDTYDLDPKPACPVKSVRVVVTDVQPGCKLQ